MLNLLLVGIEMTTFNNSLEESLRLWPDPTDAPDVPTDRLLLDYVKSPKQVRPTGLSEQVQKSINCRRAIDRLLIRRNSHPFQSLFPDSRAPEETLSDETISKLQSILAKYQLDKGVKKIAIGKRAKSRTVTEPSHGQLWTTSSKCEFWNNETKKMIKRWTFLPMMVLIIQGPAKTDWGDEVCRVVPCTDAFLWRKDAVTKDDVAVKTDTGEEYIAHLWLACMTSRSQLENCFGNVRANSGLKHIRAHLGKGLRSGSLTKQMAEDFDKWRKSGDRYLETLNKQQHEGLQEQVLDAERLASCAAYLWLTARSRFNESKSRR